MCTYKQVGIKRKSELLTVKKRNDSFEVLNDILVGKHHAPLQLNSLIKKKEKKMSIMFLFLFVLFQKTSDRIFMRIG